MLVTKISTKILAVVIAVLSLIGVAIVLLRLSILGQSVVPTDVFNAGYARHLGLTLLHIVPGLIFVLLGPLQFIPALRTKYPAFHRWSGRVYVVAGIFIGVSALMLAFIVAFTGLAGTAAIVFFASLFLIFLGLGVYRIRRREIATHREWMIRAFALGMAVTTMRPMVSVLDALTDYSFREILEASFWLGFSLHLVVAELWINLTRNAATKNIHS